MEASAGLHPGFRNRLDAIVQFRRWAWTILRVVDKFLIELETQLHDKNVSLSHAGGAHWLAQHGFDPLMGARPMARVIQIASRPLADELLFGKLVNGGRVGTMSATTSCSSSRSPNPRSCCLQRCEIAG